MVKWIKEKLGITRLEKQSKEQQSMLNILKKEDLELSLKVRSLERNFEENNRLSADISMKDTSYIILSGNWKGKPYVNIYPIYENEMATFINEFENRFGGREFSIDAPMGMGYLFQ